MCVTFRGDKRTRYLLNLNYDENDEDLRRFIPVVEHQKLTGPELDPGDILGAACEAERLARVKYGSSFEGLSFNAQLALIERERHGTCRRRAALKVMDWIRRRPTYHPIPVSRISPRRVRIRAPRRSRRPATLASRGGGDNSGGGDSDQSDPSRPRLTPVLGTVTFSLSQHRNSKAPWRRRRPGTCRMARRLLPAPRSRHGCLGPPCSSPA